MSIEAIRAKLMPKFIASAKQRTARAIEAIETGTTTIVRDEMHAITGDANMIGQGAIAELAREAGAFARIFEQNPDPQVRADCAGKLAALAARLDALVAPG